MAPTRCARWVVLLLLAAACAPAPRVAIPPTANAPLVTSSLLPPVPRVRGQLRIQVVYPAADAVVQVQDSSFLFGSAGSGEARVTINGAPARVWPNGGWLAYVPFPRDTLARFVIEARTADDSTSLVYTVRRVVDESAPLPGERVWVDSLSLSPQGRVWLGRDEFLPLSLRATEGAQVRLCLPDGSTVSLVAVAQTGELSEGVRVFGGAVDTGLPLPRSRYVGMVRGRAIGPAPGPVLPPGTLIPLVPTPGDSSWAVVEAVLGTDTARVRWPLQVALLDTLPSVAEFDDDTARTGTTDSLTVGRATPGGTYAWFFPSGTRARVSGRRNGELRVSLSASAEAWVPVVDAQPLPIGFPAPHAVVGSITVVAHPGFVTLRVPVGQRLPFKVLEGDRSLSLRVYGASGNVNWTRYGPSDGLLRALSWDQPAADEVTLSIELSRPVWGYRTHWDGNDLLLDVRRPPPINQGNPLAGRLIAVDPGHPPGGATGPTGLREAEANLAVAIELRRLLEAAGARVLMTRTTDSIVELWPRVASAERADADLLVSIHNNALPDGVNPFANNGASVYYNRERSIPLARALQSELVKRLGVRDLGIGSGDLALVRATWMPSVLTEGLFMMLPDQEAALRTVQGQQLYARALFEGIRSYLDEQGRNR